MALYSWLTGRSDTAEIRMIEEFTRTNQCDECYVSIRSYLDKSLPQLFREYIPEFFSFKADYKPAARG